MTDNSKIIRIFTMPQQFPCGPQSSCCGPVGQTDAEIQAIKAAIDSEFGGQVEVVDVTNGSDMKNHLNITRLLRSFGQTALPIITQDEEIVSMGNPSPKEAVSAILGKINQG